MIRFYTPLTAPPLIQTLKPSKFFCHYVIHKNDPENVLDNAVYYSAYYGSKENIVVFFGVVLLENAWLELRQEYPDDRTYNWFDDEVARDPLRLRKNLTNTTTDVKSPSFVKKCRVYKSIPYN